ncbi:MAG: MerR family transcriptional regulator [Crocinitomicaceae bacterium]|nr:MerR family transcriptional regulator [Crocinitomicaceae bacterium]
MFNVKPSHIRYWEKEFTAIQPRKNNKGNRLFTPKDIEIFNKIYTLVKVQGFTLEGAKNELKKRNNRNHTEEFTVDSKHSINEVVSKLEEIKSKLISLKK